MKFFILLSCALALVSGDVSHLFHAGHQHQEQAHAGYHYPKPSIAFELPQKEYLPPKPAPTYLPPTAPPTPAATYLPPTTTTPPPPPPPPAPAYLPPSSKPIYRIPIPSYAAPLEVEGPTYEYLPPVHEPEAVVEVESEPSAGGYHYDVPAIPFYY